MQNKAIEAGAIGSAALFGITLTQIDIYISIAAGIASIVAACATTYLVIKKARSIKNGGIKPKDS